MRAKDAVGRFGEELAAAHLTAAGLTILQANWRCRAGELDLIARDGDVLVFVEVKTRSTVAFGDPAEAVHPRKAARIRALAAEWLAQRREATPQERWREVRFDVVSIVRLTQEGRPSVRHVRAAF